MSYDPGRDAAMRYPNWVIRHRPLSHGIPEVLCRRRKVILIDSRQTWPEKRCSLAHAVAHLDLNHAAGAGANFDRWMEAEANGLAAQRLLPVDQLASALSWTRHASEIASELNVDLATLETRRKHLAPYERAYLQNTVIWLEESA